MELRFRPCIGTINGAPKQFRTPTRTLAQNVSPPKCLHTTPSSAHHENAVIGYGPETVYRYPITYFSGTVEYIGSKVRDIGVKIKDFGI